MFSFDRSARILGYFALSLLTACATSTPTTISKVEIYPLREGKIRQSSFDDIRRSHVVAQALVALGTPYKWGGETEVDGFDCSGLVYYAYTQSGVDSADMPRATGDLARQSESIKRSELKPGDLVFFNTLGRRYSHVGIYVGGGRFVNAPATGKKVRIDSLNHDYYKKRFTGARRLKVLSEVNTTWPPTRTPSLQLAHG